MAHSKTKITQELSPQELEAFCAELAAVPHGDMAAKIIELAKEKGIEIGRSAAYEFKNKEALPWLRRLQLRKEKARMVAEAGEDDSGRTLADAAAAELGQIAFDMVSELDGQIDITTEEGRLVFDAATKGIHRLRTGDRAMITQLQKTVKELEDQRREADKALKAASGKEGGISDETIKAVRQALGMSTEA